MCSCTLSDFDVACEPGRRLYGQAATLLALPVTPGLFSADDAIRGYREHCYQENARLVYETRKEVKS